MTISSDFWATSAQVIPTLMLVIVLERRFTQADRGMSKPVLMVIVTLTFAVTVLAEFLALKALATGNGSVAEARLVVLSLGALTTIIVSTFLLTFSVENAELHGARLSRWANVLALVVSGAAASAPIAIATWVAGSL